MSLSFPSLSNPITKSGRVVLNAKKDRNSIRTRQFSTQGLVDRHILSNRYKDKDGDENYSILNHEIALHVKSGSETNFLKVPHDGSISVVTSCNGWQPKCGFSQEASGTKAAGLDDHQKLRKDLKLVYLPFTATKDMDAVTFAGIAATRAKHDSRDAAANEDDCVVQTGGMCTMYNNGPHVIEVNNFVMWDFPGADERVEKRLPKPEGVPRTKGQFVPHPVQKLFTALDEAFDKSTQTSDWRDTVTKLRQFDKYRHNINSRVIGRSLTRAAPGQAFDLLLGAFIA